MTDKYYWTHHALENLEKRFEIKSLWVIDCIEQPDFSEKITDNSGGKIYYYKKIKEFDNRVLKVVTSASDTPIRIITIHFHRGLKGKI